MYYGEYCIYGVSVPYTIKDGNAYDFYAFPTKAERDTWVDAHEYNGTDYVAAPVKRRVMEKVIGKDFKVVPDYYGNGLNAVVRA